MCGGQDEQPLVGRSKAQDGSVRVQAGHLLLGDLAHLTRLLPVDEDRVHGRRLAVDEGAAETLTQRCVGDVRSAGGELLIPLGRLNVTCEGDMKGEGLNPLTSCRRHNRTRPCEVDPEDRTQSVEGGHVFPQVRRPVRVRLPQQSVHVVTETQTRHLRRVQLDREQVLMAAKVHLRSQAEPGQNFICDKSLKQTFGL